MCVLLEKGIASAHMESVFSHGFESQLNSTQVVAWKFSYERFYGPGSLVAYTRIHSFVNDTKRLWCFMKIIVYFSLTCFLQTGNMWIPKTCSSTETAHIISNEPRILLP